MESELAYKPIDANETVGEDYTNIVNNMQKLTQGNTNIVLTNDTITTADGQQANGVYKDGVIYLSAKASTAEKLSFVAGHEITHTLEGTKEYAKLAKAIDKLIAGIRRVTEEVPKKTAKENWESVKQKTAEGWLASQIEFTNAQAGIEHVANRDRIEPVSKLIMSVLVW